MLPDKRFPALKLRGKRSIAKRFSSRSLTLEQALDLLVDAIKNFDSYWYDSSASKIEEKKFVRSAAGGNSLDHILHLIDKKILSPYDTSLPDFIFGGIGGRNHIQAASHLIESKGERVLIELDVERFFEKVSKGKIINFFLRCGCDLRTARVLASLCCVPQGPKSLKSSYSSPTVLARGFAPSSRLAVWTNLDAFLRLDWFIKKELKGHSPRVAIFIDDIGIMASGVTKERMEEVALGAIKILEQYRLPINIEKKKIRSSDEPQEWLGLRLGRKLSLGKKPLSKRAEVKKDLKNAKTVEERKNLKKRYKGYKMYERQVKLAQKKKG